MPVSLTNFFGRSAKLAPSLLLLICESFFKLWPWHSKKHPENVTETGGKWSQFGAVSETLGLALCFFFNKIIFTNTGPINPDTGLPTHQRPEENDLNWPYRGRPEHKSFLYEIVANKSSGIDVDKWDYFLRDDSHLNIGHVFKYERFIQFSRVFKTGLGQRTKICLRDKEAELVEEMFRDRTRLHRHGYQHRVTKIIDRMMVRMPLKKQF